MMNIRWLGLPWGFTPGLWQNLAVGSLDSIWIPYDINFDASRSSFFDIVIYCYILLFMFQTVPDSSRSDLYNCALKVGNCWELSGTAIRLRRSRRSCPKSWARPSPRRVPTHLCTSRVKWTCPTWFQCPGLEFPPLFFFQKFLGLIAAQMSRIHLVSIS